MSLPVPELLSDLYAFFGQFVVAVVLLIFFCLVYLRVTPYPELRLIREGKSAPAVSFGGALIGFVLPLASAIIHSRSMDHMAIWALVALAIQTTLFVILRCFFSSLVRAIAEDHMGAAILAALFSVATGMLNAACMAS